MAVSDWALIISLLSLAVSGLSLFWNIWSKFIYPKPKVRVSAGVVRVYDQELTSEPFVSLAATNYGPGQVTLTHVVAEAGWFTRRGQPTKMLLNILTSDPGPDETAYLFGRNHLPRKIDVGENYSVPLSLQLVAFDPPHRAVRFGFSDTFGRYHWVKGRALRHFLQDFRKAQGEKGEVVPPVAN